MRVEPDYYPFIIAAASLIVIPGILAISRRIGAAFDSARAMKLKDAIHTELAPIHAQQEKHHQQNRDFLETIRTEAYQREVRIVASIDGLRSNLESKIEAVATKSDAKLDTVHRRVDDLAKMSGDRRRRPPD